jgi:hypothetical protein
LWLLQDLPAGKSIEYYSLLHPELPSYTSSGWDINIHVLADRLAAPVMVGRSRFAGWKKFWQQIRSLVKFKKEN